MKGERHAKENPESLDSQAYTANAFLEYKGMEKVILPHPIPDYVPGPVRDLIASQYPGGVKQLAGRMDAKYTTVVNLFQRRQHRSFRCFLDLAESLNISPDDLCRVVMQPAPLRKQALFALIGHAGSTRGLVDAESEHYLYTFLQGVAGNKVATIYAPMARALGVDLKTLGGMLL